MSRILFSNIGYARDINGSLGHHVTRFSRNFYCGPAVQQQVLNQLKAIIDRERPDLCCLVEIDQGSIHSAWFNQIEALMDERYRFHDVADKYGDKSRLGKMPLHQGKSNAFMALREYPFERLYFRHGTKRLIYRLDLPGDVALYFAHFSLQKNVRLKQFHEVRQLMRERKGAAMILADFNIFQGYTELQPLLAEGELVVVSREEEPTFTFHRQRLSLDLCLCSPDLAERTKLTVIPQPYSDHAALLVEI